MGQYPKQEQNPGHWIESARVAPIIQNWLDDHLAKHNTKARGARVGNRYGTFDAKHGGAQVPSSGATDTLSFMSGIHPRKILGICKAEYKYVSLYTVDELFTAMDCNFLFTLPPEQGGFSDVYWHESVMKAA